MPTVFCDNHGCIFIDEDGFCDCDKLDIVGGECMGSVHGSRNKPIERIDENTWRNDDGDEISAHGLTLTVEFGDKTKAEILEAVAEVKDENTRLRELCEGMLVCYESCNEHLDARTDCPLYDDGEPFRCKKTRLLRELGIGS